MKSIKVAIAGIGNCASSLVQGIEYYRTPNASVQTGLMHMSIGGWKPSDIEIVAAFDVDNRKVGYSLEEAVFAAPNCTRVFSTGAAGIRSACSNGAGARRDRGPHGELRRQRSIPTV